MGKNKKNIKRVEDKEEVSSKFKSLHDIFKRAEYDYPIFCFKYLHKDHCITQCDKDERSQFVDQLKSLCSVNWNQLNSSGRHGMGWEKIDFDSIIPSKPSHVSGDITFIAFRFDGKKAMVGYRYGFVFHIVYLDRDFTVYKH